MIFSTISDITFTSADDLTPVITHEDEYTPKIITIDGHRRFDKRLRTMHELCGYGCVQGRTRLKRLHKVNDQEMKRIDEDYNGRWPQAI